MRLNHFVVLIFCMLFASNIFAATLSERTFKRLTKIHDLMAESQYDEALVLLDKLKPKAKRSKYEYATVMQTYGFAYASKDQYKKAVDAFQESLKTRALPKEIQQPMRYNISQLLAAIPDYKASAEAYEVWFLKAKKPSAANFVFAATIYAQLKDYDKAVKNIKTAIDMTAEPKEVWYQLLLAMYYSENKYQKSAEVLETMVSRWPDNVKYWGQLSGIYFALNKNMEALAVQELSHKQGFLNDEKELMNLVNMYLFENIPYKGAVLLEREINAGRIPKSGDNLQKLGEAWMFAKELDKALFYLDQAAVIQKKGELFLQMAQLYTDKEDWAKVVNTIDLALNAGDLKSPGKAYLLLGMAHYEDGDKTKALTAFREGNKFPKTANQAKQWITHISSDR